ncbi:MAG: ATP-binding protein [Anaerolineae bacterium]
MMVERGSLEPSSLFHQIMETLMEGIAITNVRGQVVFANHALEQLLGYEPGELVGQCWTSFADDLNLGPETGEDDTPGRYETRLLHKRGVEIPVVASNFPLSDGDHEAGTLSTFTDLREDGLLPAVTDATTPVLAGQRIASIVHELNNSLSILTLQAQILHRKGELNPKLTESLVAIQDETVRMTTMVESLRVAADPHNVQLKPTNINMLIVQTLELQRPLIDEADIELQLHLEASLPTTEADPLRLQQVFVNLINNARQAIEASPGCGKLVIGTRLVGTDDGAPNRIQVSFSDNGPGISPDVMPHIFEPFFTTKLGNGMGLGLPICQQILEKHDGRIWAEENSSSGATFVLELPVVEGCRDGDCGPVGSSNGLHPHILVVDDEPDVVQTVGEFLQQEGFTVTTATAARKALTLLERNNIDLIISDLSMPQMGGRQFWTKVHQSRPDLARRIIFSTGDSSGRRSLAFLQSSGCAWIEKPFEPEELLRLIDQRLESEPDLASTRQEVAEAA